MKISNEMRNEIDKLKGCKLSYPTIGDVCNAIEQLTEHKVVDTNRIVLKCQDCDSTTFIGYNGPLLMCEECGQFFDTSNFCLSEELKKRKQITERPIPLIKKAVLDKIPDKYILFHDESVGKRFTKGERVDLSKHPELEPLCTITEEIDWEKLVGCVVTFDYTHPKVINAKTNKIACIVSDFENKNKTSNITNCSGFLMSDDQWFFIVGIKNLEVLKWKE